MKRLTVMAAAVLLAACTAAPAQAGSNQAAAASLAIEGAVDLAGGTFFGTAAGQVSGSYTTSTGERVPWSLVTVNPTTAQLTSVDILGCAAGTVTGRFRIRTDNGGQVFGAWVDRAVFPQYIVALDATIDFVWHRVATGGALVVTDAVVDIQLYTAAWTGFDDPAGWVRVVDSSHAKVGGGEVRVESGDPTTCASGVLKGELTLAAS